ncbi:MAG: DUF3786 domain-containing protein [candidate division Zixibacteria bacterium]|nr:DUF3786 domain-containing protein [candidate division Zixibacteria bacterium]
MSNYAEIIKQNLDRLYNPIPPDLADWLPAQKVEDGFIFPAFGESCQISPQGIKLGDTDETGPKGVVISLYALQASPVSCQLTPFKAFREMPDSMPYVGAFASRTEQVLFDQIDGIEQHADRIARRLDGTLGSDNDAGDFSLIIYPLPKISLNYIFYRADDDFAASVTCLFSSNAGIFLPTDALADTGEYTSKKILETL